MDDVAGGDGVSEINFSDKDKAMAWLQKQSIEVRAAIISRVAIRYIPAIITQQSMGFDALNIALLRAILVSTVRSQTALSQEQYDELSKLTIDAAEHAVSAANSFHKAAEPDVDKFGLEQIRLIFAAFSSSANAAILSTSNSVNLNTINSLGFMYHGKNDPVLQSLFLKALLADVQNEAVTVMEEPVWHNTPAPDRIENLHKQYLEKLSSAPEVWSFWQEWYLAMRAGRFTDWGLALEIANIPNGVWESGAEDVALAISTISDGYLTNKLPQAEILFENEFGKYDVRPSIADPSKLTESVLSRAGFAYNMAIESNACDLNSMSTPGKILRHVFENCTDDPNAIEQFFRQASNIIKRKIEDGQFSIDDELEVLIRTLDESALQMRADHPEVGEAADKRLKQRLREIDDAKRLEIATKIDAMVEGSTGRLAAEFELSAETTRSDSGVAAQTSAIKMSSERAAKISMAERAKKAEGSGIMSGVKIGMRGNSLVELVISLLSGGG